MKRGVRTLVTLAVVSASLVLGMSGARGQADPAKKIKVMGFAQEGAESDWRKANTLSMQDEAKKRGIELKFSDAQEKQENQIKAIRSFINQGVDVIVFAPIVKDGWDDVLKEAKAAHIPVIIEDRMANASPDLYAAYVGSDFKEEGQRAGAWLAKATNEKATIACIEGVQGSDAAEGRKQGFNEEIKKHPNMKVAVSKVGDFQRAKGKEVAQAILKSNPDITAMFIHNDDMALGAIQAVKEAGLQPGKDITIVSVDGIKGAFEAMLAGDLNCSVECNPLLGPQVFDLAEKVVKGEAVPKVTHSNESVFDAKAVTPAVVASRKY